jgi:tetratricopeptide (TPR) repeat protein
MQSRNNRPSSRFAAVAEAFAPAVAFVAFAAFVAFGAFVFVALSPSAYAQSGATRPRRVPPSQPAVEESRPVAAPTARAQQPAAQAVAGSGGDVRRGEELFNQKQYEAALAEAQRVAAANPKNSSAWRLAGFARVQLRQYAEAASDLRRAYDLRRAEGEDDPALVDKLAEALVLSEQYELSIPHLVAATTRAGAQPDSVLLYYRGLAEYRTKRLDEAARSFESAVKADPKNALSLFYLGRINYERGQVDAAIAAFNRATAAKPDLAEAWTLLTIAYLARAARAQGTPASDADYLNAVRSSDALVRLRADESALTLSGQSLFGAKQYARAAAVLERAAAAPNAQGQTLYLLGVAHSRAKAFPKAIAALERAAGKSPEDVNIYRELGYALEVSKQYARALAAYERGAELAPEDADFKQSIDRVRPFAK